MVDDRKPVDHPLGFGKIVRDKEDGRSRFARFGEELPEDLAADRVDVIRRLIQDEQPGN